MTVVRVTNANGSKYEYKLESMFMKPETKIRLLGFKAELRGRFKKSPSFDDLLNFFMDEHDKKKGKK